MTVFAFDITANGSNVATADAPPEGGYRWAHFDLDDPHLTAFLDTHVPAIPAAALVAPETRPRADRFGDGLMLNLRGVNLTDDGPADQMVAVRMWVTAHLIVTVRMRQVFALDTLREDAAQGYAPATPMMFVSSLSTRLMGRVQDTVFDLSGRVDGMEDSVQDDDSPLPPELAEERRMAIRLRRYLAPQRDALVALVGTDSPLMSQSARDLLREQANLAKLNVEELEGLIARMTAVQDHHTAQAALLQGHNGYVLSIIAAVFLPLGFITGLFGVNVAGMPGINTSWAFAALCAGLVAMSVGAVWVLRWLKWI
ncbi:zinc transporter ZntB [uncultured Tateyamaria sp.]|uniref:zinc transporter ZntB n=1 Tax=uncultured Tateyamaria sp. TaxID=455651 RepID=UPI002620505D|nr:zinc transporter ZntB [uncultured Tateyamaria sp.]